jgi:FdhD protein
LQASSDFLAIEEPLEIRLRGKGIAVTMRTPGHDEELAAGFLISEGLIKTRSDIVAIAHCASGEQAELKNVLQVFVPPKLKIHFKSLTRHVFASSSCGLCGKATIESVQHQFPPVDSGLRISPETLSRLPDTLREAQQAFDKTGGLHAAGLFNSQGELLVAREDVGRHNAVDKVIGHAFLNGPFPLSGSILMVSGRASFEIMQKALAARIPVVAAVSAPSSLAVEFARQSQQTLIGFLRGRSFNVYSHPARMISP